METKETGNQRENTIMLHGHDHDENRKDDKTDSFYQAVAVAIDEVKKPAPKGGGKTAKAHEAEISRRLDEAFGFFDSGEA